MKILGLSIMLLSVTVAPPVHQRSAVGESAPGRRMASALEERLHILDPVPITDQRHQQNRAATIPVKVGDRILIRVTHGTMKPQKVEVSFSTARMTACEIIKVPATRNKKNDLPGFAVVVKAIEEKPCVVMIECTFRDGTRAAVCFPFAIESKLLSDHP